MIKSRGKTGAFTLTEIALAVGIIAFGLIAVLGLIPAGLNTLRYGRDELVAANFLRSVSDGLRGAERMGTNFPATYHGGGVLTNLSWTIGASTPVAQTLTNLTSGGAPAARPEDALLNARIVVQPSPDGRSASSAFVSVAWPAVAEWDGQKWIKEQGQISSHIVFLPK